MSVNTEEQIVMTPFLKKIVSQIRAYDTYGTWDKRKDEDIIKDFVKDTKKPKMDIMSGGHCEVDPKALLKIQSFYKAVAFSIEKNIGVMCSTVLNLDHEGSGLLLIYAGRLILILKGIRDAGSFGFKSVEAIEKEGQKLIESALKIYEKYKEVANI